GQMEDENLKGMGASAGIGDSPWLAAQRASNLRSTDQAIASGNQNLSIQAATTNRQAKENAASLGTNYQSMKGSQVMSAVSAGLQRASVTGDRMQLRESVAQAAAASKQSAQQIMANWLVQNAGLKLSYAQLSTQNTQYLEDLMMRTQQLNEQRSEFAANYGLQSDSLDFAKSQAGGGS